MVEVLTMKFAATYWLWLLLLLPLIYAFIAFDEKECYKRFRYHQEGPEMDNWTFGITMIVIGMGGTILTLWILSLLMGVLKKVFPYRKEEAGK